MPCRFLCLSLLLSSALWLSACSFIPQQATEVPQSAPFCSMLEAARLSQDARFFECYSSNVRQLEPDPSVFADAQKNLTFQYGNWQVSDFHFTYEGDETRGVLNVFFKNRRDVTLPVVNENGQWKIDTH